jgi:hypothetical protein
VEYNSHPPRYDAHSFPKATRPVPLAKVEPARPGSPIRGLSDESIASISFGEDLTLDLGQSASRSVDDITASGPPSPTGISQIKNDAAAKMAEMGKVGTGVSVTAVALGVELLI